MVEIKDLLNSFKEILYKEEYRKEKVSLIIENITKLKIKTEDIEIKNGVVFLNIKPLFKNEILIKKEKILQEFKEVFSKRTIINIK